MKKISKRQIRLALGAYRISMKIAADEKKKEESFEEAVKGETFKNPDTGNDVSFGSLPAEEQKKIRDQWKKKNDDLQLSDEDKKLMEEFRELDLSEEEIFEMFSAIADTVDAVDDDALEELKGMDGEELEGQLEALMTNHGDDELTKAIEDALKEISDEDLEEESDSDKEMKKLNEEKKQQAKEDADQINSWADQGWLDDDDLRIALEGALDSIRNLDEEYEDLDLDSLSAEEIRETLSDVLSSDPQYARTLAFEFDQEVDLRQFNQHRDQMQEMYEEHDDASGDLYDLIARTNLNSLDIDQAEKILKDYKDLKDRIRKDYKDTTKKLIEDVGGERAIHHMDFFGGNPEKWGEDDWDEQMSDATFSSIDVSKVEERLKSLKIEDRKKKNKERAEKVKKDKEESERKRKEEERRKNMSPEEVMEENAEKRKDKSYREEAKKKALEGISSATDQYTGESWYQDGFAAEAAFASLREAYGFGVGPDLDADGKYDFSQFDEETLDDFISAMEEIDAEASKQFNEMNKKDNKEVAEARKRLAENTATLKKEQGGMEKKLNELSEKMRNVDDSDEYERIAEQYDEISGRLDSLQKSIRDDEEITESYETKLEDMDTIIDYSENLESLLHGAIKAKGNKKEQREFEEAKKKKEEEHKQKVKDYTKKINDLISSASSAKKSSEITELFAEFGRIKGQLSGGEVFEEVKGDLKKAEKALKDAQEELSFGGKLKSFFGLGKGKKKASKAQRDKVAKIALELLKEEIALYKEEEARRNRKR